MFGEADDGDAFGRQTIEHRNLTLMIDSSTKQQGKQDALRTLRGTVDTLVRALGGADASVTIEPHEPYCAAYENGAFGKVSINGAHVGVIGAIDASVSAKWGLETPVACAEVNLPALDALYPPANKARTLPTFPAIERDLSVVLPEAAAWASIESILAESALDKLEGAEFVGVFRGKQVGAGKKSVTFRLRFRDEARTLRHEEVDPQIKTLVGALSDRLGAELRA